MIVPVILIVMTAIEVARIVLNPDAKVVKSAMSRTIQKIIASVAIFFLPLLVNVLLGLLNETKYSNTSCWTNSTNEVIAQYREAQRIQEEAEKAKIADEKQKVETEQKIVEATREAARKDNEKKAAEAAKNASQGSTSVASALGARVVQIAQREYDSIDHSRPLGRPNKYTSAFWPDEWCAMFVWWVSNEAGVYPSRVSLKSAGVCEYRHYFESGSNGVRFEMSEARGGHYIPKMGDYILFIWQGSGDTCGSHIGIVKGVSGDRVMIIDGNNGDTIRDYSRYLNDVNILGYGVWE